MCRYQFLNIETCHIIIADTHDAALQLGLTEAAIIDATRDVNLRRAVVQTRPDHTRFCRFSANHPAANAKLLGQLSSSPSGQLEQRGFS